MSGFKIKREDKVVVIAGSQKGVIGTVVKVDIKKNRVYVSGTKVNTKYKKKNALMGQTSGSMTEVPRPIHVSNVMLHIDGVGGSRIGYKITDGKKIRFAKKNGAELATPKKVKSAIAAEPVLTSSTTE